MGKNNKKGGSKTSKASKANVFKVAGAKSLKKTKAKSVNLGLKNSPTALMLLGMELNLYFGSNIESKDQVAAKKMGIINKIKQKVAAMDKEFVEINKQKQKPAAPKQKKAPKKKTPKVTKEDVSKAADKIVAMDL